MLGINSKLPHTGTTIFTVMSKMASDHQAINLSQGFPDFKVSSELVSLVHRYMQMGMNQYAPMEGDPELRKQIGLNINRLYHCEVDPGAQITITAGATEALFAAISATVNPGDEVIIFEPAYDSYVPAVQLNQGVPVPIPLELPDFGINWDLVKRKIGPKTKLIIINSPHNPTGAVISANDLRQLADLVRDTDILILSDEVYEHIIFDEESHQSILLHQELMERSMVVYSFGKVFHATGWKVGYCIAPDWLTIEIRKVHQFLTFSVNTPTQFALAQYLNDHNNYAELAEFYQKKRDLFLDLMKGSRFVPLKSSGTYFQLFSYKDISDQPDIEMAEQLTTQSGVASIPISVFYSNGRDDHILRFCFAKSDDTLKSAAEILCKV